VSQAHDHGQRALVEGSGRLEAFSDGVFAIVVTLLIIEVHLPELDTSGNEAMWAALVSIAPKLISFTVSFATIAIYWVNHHHFFSRVTHSDWKLLWANNFLLFWLTVVPFTTAVVGDHPGEPVAVFVYGLNLGLAAAAFSLMGWYVFFKGDLVSPAVTMDERRSEFRRAAFGAVVYFGAAFVGLVAAPIALIAYAIMPLVYVVPTLLAPDADTSG
jgi:TMEM175 potassium channel family protein